MVAETGPDPSAASDDCGARIDCAAHAPRGGVDPSPVGVGGVEYRLPGENEPQVVPRVVVGEDRLLEPLAGAEVTTTVTEVDHRRARGVVRVLGVAAPVAVGVHPGHSPAGGQQLQRAEGTVPGLVPVPASVVGVRDRGIVLAVEDGSEYAGHHPVLRIVPLPRQVARLDLPDGGKQRHREVALCRCQGHRQAVGVNELRADARPASGTTPEEWVHPRVLEGSAAWTTRAFSGPGTVTEACWKVAFGATRALRGVARAHGLAAEDDQEHAECQHRTL